MTDSVAIRFDDLDALKAVDSFGPWSQARTITQESVNAFGALTGDLQWIHVDPERARVDSPTGGTIGHGFFILSLIADLRKSDGIDIVGHGSALNYGIDRLRFTGPVPVGKAIHCRSRIADAAPRGGGTMIDRDIAVHVVGHNKPCLIFSWKLLYLPQPAGNAATKS